MFHGEQFHTGTVHRETLYLQKRVTCKPLILQKQRILLSVKGKSGDGKWPYAGM